MGRKGPWSIALMSSHVEERKCSKLPPYSRFSADRRLNLTQGCRGYRSRIAFFKFAQRPLGSASSMYFRKEKEAQKWRVGETKKKVRCDGRLQIKNTISKVCSSTLTRGGAEPSLFLGAVPKGENSRRHRELTHERCSCSSPFHTQTQWEIE